MNKIMTEIQALQEVVTRFRQMRLDATEFACLKCIVTFKAGLFLEESCCAFEETGGEMWKGNVSFFVKK